MKLVDLYAADFILDIQDVFMYSYDCVDDHEWNETVAVLLAANFPHGLREDFEKIVIRQVYRQAQRGGWEEYLCEFDALNNPEWQIPNN